MNDATSSSTPRHAPVAPGGFSQPERQGLHSPSRNLPSGMPKPKFSGASSPRYPYAGSPPASPPGGVRRSTSSVYSDSGREGCFSHVRMTAGAKCSRFFRRIVHFRHMDFEFACWQMIYLLVAPQKVYRNFLYRKRTKDQFARDDPAFLVVLSSVLAVSSIIYAVVMGLSFFGFFKFLLWVIFIDCIGSGLVIASILWLFSNRFLRRSPDDDVEWGFCFDVHLNAFFPMLVFLHMIVPLLYPVVIGKLWFVSRFVGNTFWFIAIGYYLYITFLGYTALRFLKNTHVFLYPFTFLFIAYVVTITIGWNIQMSMMHFYHYRIS